MGRVYRARDTCLGRDVAIKVLPDHLASDRKALALFESEARAIAALSHPGIPSLFDVGETDGIHYAVTELLEGETLRALLARGPIPVKSALEIAHQVAEGLAAAHEDGIVYRDLKPENVFLTKDGHARILGFGLARHETAFRDPSDTRSPTVSAHTEAGAVLGTVTHMSPSRRAAGQWATAPISSLGTVLYQVLAGNRPFQGATAVEAASAAPDVRRRRTIVLLGLVAEVLVGLGFTEAFALLRDSKERPAQDHGGQDHLVRSSVSDVLRFPLGPPGSAASTVSTALTHRAGFPDSVHTVKY